MDFESRLRSLILLCVVCSIAALPEPGVWQDVPVPKDNHMLYFVKNMFKDTVISVEIQCTPAQGNKNKLNIGWVLRQSPCTQEYHQNYEGLKDTNVAIKAYFKEPTVNLYEAYTHETVQYLNFSSNDNTCGETINLKDMTKDAPKNGPAMTFMYGDDEKLTETNTEGISNVKNDIMEPDPATTKPKQASVENPSRRKRADEPEAQPTLAIKPLAVNKTVSTTPNPRLVHPEANDQKGEYHVAKIWASGSYIFILKIEGKDGAAVDAKVTVRMKSKVGYISAFEWPLLIFYGVMGLVYIIYGLIWLVMMACNWRDLLRLQYWIGGVILLGMVEKGIFFSEYQSIANRGTSITSGAAVFAEIFSCLKRALARMLVIIASLGFGIVRPRLGPAFHKVLFTGGLYFVVATVEGCMRSLRRISESSNDLMLVQVPLALIDAAICWWIFSSLMQTIRQLRLRRNVVKLSLYRHFTNTLIFAVGASIIFMIWWIVQIKRKVCMTDWQELWVNDAFWHLLFMVILMVIIVLWRPSSNNQRYAFSPLLDAEDDEEEDDTVMNDAFDGMKMRAKHVNGSPKPKQSTIEDDLKWVEENIPSAISDKVSAVLDSDEEIETAKYEMSKMQ